MVKVKPFKGIRPPRELAKEVAARPYDVLNSEEAKAEANEKSLLHITRPEIDFTPMVDEHSQEAYDKAVENKIVCSFQSYLIGKYFCGFCQFILQSLNTLYALMK